ncbi:small ribosomal subunit Rsm22 family protein [Phenylobacterium sp.]|uniref:small ribosomal subunit Rsm22 family protein n=1 Tax=Phenylobacterium sp. TaxID=1871053 RepID=UPI00286AC482|nr:small ribosomal subunit Rsm22 family protein [Phenylobacterium sp.]
MTPDLPPALRQAADRLLDGVSRKGLAEQSARISAQYRSGKGSAAVVGSAADATAYVLTRLPATYAAGAHVLAEAARIAPDFAPKTLFDAGAGPGGASWAALETWPGIAAAALLDSNAAFLDMARTLAASGPAALRDAQRLRGDLTAPKDWPAADLVIASYALAEIAPARQAETLAALWASTLGLLVLIEPGTPDGYGRVLTARDRLIEAGAAILAPCPHHAACPLVAPDWCHFVQRLPRSRDHRLAKGGEAPFEDETFIYLVASRSGVGRREARILAPPHAAKPGITLKLCTLEGAVEPRFVARRDKPAYAVARRLGWGDVLPGAE